MLAFPSFFFFNDTATTEIYTLSLHDALPICGDRQHLVGVLRDVVRVGQVEQRIPVRRIAPQPGLERARGQHVRSEEHTSELQSPDHLVCRLLLEKKNQSTLTRFNGMLRT